MLKDVQCKLCGKFYSKKGIGTHIWRCHVEKGKQHNPNKGFNDNRIIWNKGQTKTTSNIVLQISQKTSSIQKRKTLNGENVLVNHSKMLEKREMLSKLLTLHNPGGRCKWYKVGQINVQGRWERDLAVLMNRLDISWEKTKKFFKYTLDGKIKRYTPDFFLQQLDLFIEVKGYWWGNDLKKMEEVIKQNLTLKIKIIQKDIFMLLMRSQTKEEFLKILCPDGGMVDALL